MTRIRGILFGCTDGVAAIELNLVFDSEQITFIAQGIVPSRFWHSPNGPFGNSHVFALDTEHPYIQDPSGGHLPSAKWLRRRPRRVYIEKHHNITCQEAEES